MSCWAKCFRCAIFRSADTKEIAAFIEDTISFGDWTVIAAVRADRFDLSPERDAMYVEDYPDYELVSLSESDLSPKLGVIYAITEASICMYSIRTAFVRHRIRTPTSASRFRSSAIEPYRIPT